MIREKAFHLKVRKAKIRWGCPCCQPVGRTNTTRAAHRVLSKLIKAKDRREQKLLAFIDADGE